MFCCWLVSFVTHTLFLLFTNLFCLLCVKAELHIQRHFWWDFQKVRQTLLVLRSKYIIIGLCPGWHVSENNQRCTDARK